MPQIKLKNVPEKNYPTRRELSDHYYPYNVLAQGSRMKITQPLSIISGFEGLINHSSLHLPCLSYTCVMDWTNEPILKAMVSIL